MAENEEDIQSRVQSENDNAHVVMFGILYKKLCSIIMSFVKDKESRKFVNTTPVFTCCIDLHIEHQWLSSFISLS